jgi:hypothetical protein
VASEYYLGSVVRLELEARDADDVLTDPSTLTVAVRKPDRVTTLTYGLADMTHPTVGRYVLDVPGASIDQVGPWVAVWTATGRAAGVRADPFDVRDPFRPVFIDLSEAKARLNKSSAVVTDDDELSSYISAAEDWIEAQCGPVTPRTVTETVTAECGRLRLSMAPVVSVDSVTQSALAVSTSDWIVTPGGRVSLRYGRLFGDYAVTYTAGRASVPERLKRAALELVAHWWESQRGTAGPPRIGGSDPDGYTYAAATGLGYAIPNRVTELIADYKRPAAVA